MSIDESDLYEVGVRIEHRGALWDVTPIAVGSWVVRGAEGRTVGSLVLIAPEGEEGDPVYGGCLPGETVPLHEGSDWDSIVRALINEALDD